jgi:hypothetical protein
MAVVSATEFQSARRQLREVGLPRWQSRVIIASVAKQLPRRQFMLDFDQQLVRAYASLGETVDRIASFKSIREQFLRQLPPAVLEQDHDHLIWRLFRLRKSGKLGTREGKR